MIKNLIKAAAELDHAGFHVEADLMDKIMQKVAEELDDDGEETDGSEEMEDSEFGFLGGDEAEEDDDEAYEEEPDEEELDEDSEQHSVEECLHYCKSFSHEEKVELIKALLDSMMD